MIVMKFGGTSVGNPDRIRNVYDIVKRNLAHKPVVVVSAVAGVTDLLLKAGDDALRGKIDISEIEQKHNAIVEEFGFPTDFVSAETEELRELLKGISMLKELSPRASDYLVSFGERISSVLVAKYLDTRGIRARHYFAYDLGLVTDENFQSASPYLSESYANIRKSLHSLNHAPHVPVITGFLGRTRSGVITTLGRGGSDYSGALFGAALEASEIQIWTDVDGVMTTDPRIVPCARNVPVVSFQEASELAYFGAKVLHPKTIVPAIEKNIPVFVKNTANPDHPGTKIIAKSAKSKETVKAISIKKGIKLINIYSLRMFEAHGFLARIFNIFEKYNVVVDMISTSEVSVSVTVDIRTDTAGLERELREFANVRIGDRKAIVCIVGEGLKTDETIVGKVFKSISDMNVTVEMISQGASDINLALVLPEAAATEVVKALHRVFFE